MNDTPAQGYTARTNRAGRNIPSIKVMGDKKAYTYREVLDFAHSVGFVRSEIEVIQSLSNADRTVCQATVFYVDPEATSDSLVVSYSDIGDADQKNGGIVKVHHPRMAATRALARAHAQALNLDANFSEEFGGDEEPAFTKKPTVTPRATTTTAKPGWKPKTT